MTLKNRLLHLLQLKEEEHLDQEQESELDGLIDEIIVAAETDTKRGWKMVLQKSAHRQKRRRIISFVRAAAIVVPISMVALYLLTKNKEGEVITAEADQPKEVVIIPAGKVAYLTKSSGEVIDLSKTVKDNTIIISEEDGAKFMTDSSKRDTEYNHLTVPRGGEYKITLSDGTKVWLNSDSKIKFPTVFLGEVREVWLEGEALFEVTKQNGKEFIVHTKKMDINVKGTLFNVMAYENESRSETTLISGVVDVSLPNGGSTLRLAPSQQATLEEGSREFIKREVNTKPYLLSREGVLFFDDDSFHDIAKRIERWYDVTITFENREMMEQHYYGTINKSQTIEEIFKILSLTETVNYTIKGREITIL